MEKNISKHIREICNAIGNGFGTDKKKRDCALSAFESTINSMGDYVNAVLYMETGIQVARFRLEGDEFRDRVMDLDRRRKTAHDAMLGRVASLNRICSMVGCPVFFEGDVENRHAVADYAITVVRSLFASRVQKNGPMSIDEIKAAVEAED